MTTMLTNVHLKDINAVRPFSRNDPQDIQCFNEIRVVLEKFGYQDRFGLCLLHKHFDVYADECLVERCNISTRTLEVTPTKKDELHVEGTLIETSWNLLQTSPGREVSCETYCWVDSRGSHNRSHRRE